MAVVGADAPKGNKTPMSSMTQEYNSINTEIEAARARWAAKRVVVEEEERQQEARRQAERAASRARIMRDLAAVMPEWALEYVGWEINYSSRRFYKLQIPGCSPIELKLETWGLLIGFSVGCPLAIEWDDEAEEWYVSWRPETPADDKDFDAALDLAASYGESWHEMQTEAARRNAQGIKPAPAGDDTQALTAFDRAGDALELARRDVRDAEPEYAQAIALLAIAEAIHALIDAIRQGR